MTSPGDDEAMKAMARRIADELIPDPENESVVYKSFHRTAERAALAAIIEMQERDAALAENYFGPHNALRSCGSNIARAIRSGQQFRKDQP